MSALGAALCNIVASVGIILTNKQLVTGLRFHFILTTLCLNFFTTSCICSGLAYAGHFEPKSFPSWDRWRVAFLAVLTVLLNNASVEANSVGFYQIFKLLIIPTVIVTERLQGVKRSYSYSIIVSLIVSSIGVGMATISDVQINARGFILAVLSDIVTAQFQIWQGGKQHQYGLTSTQIQHAVGWPQTLIAACGTLLLDVLFSGAKGHMLLTPGSILDFQWSDNWLEARWLVACCMIAVVMNISTYALIGKTSPVTYQVIGQVKTCLVVSFGYFLFDHKAPSASPARLIFRFAGVAVASSGILAYGIQKTREQKVNDAEQKAKKA